MIELQRHIEILLLENDCVIVPQFGGFMAHHVEARYDKNDNSFLPPLRTIGFNPQLTMNDSLLVQSYIEAYDLSYPEALHRIEDEVNELRQQLESDGYYELNDLGVLNINLDGNISFEPCEAGILTPDLYGLSNFGMLPLSAQMAQDKQASIEVTEKETAQPDAPQALSLDEILNGSIKDNNDKHYHIPQAWVRNAVAAAAVVIMFFLLPTKTGNPTHYKISTGSIDTGMLIRLLPKAKSTSEMKWNVVPKDSVRGKNKNTNKKEQIVDIQSTKKEYYSIVLASRTTKTNAIRYVDRLHADGMPDVFVHSNHLGSAKVLYGKFTTEQEARKNLRTLTNKEEFKDSWVMKVRH